MPHGAPDDSNVVKTGVVHRIDDLAEAVVRAGSPNVWDRRGDVVYLSDFREGMGAFDSFSGGTDGGIALMTGHSRQGAYSVRLRAPDEELSYAYLHLAFPFQDPSKVGFELSFSVAEHTLAIEVIIAWLDGTTERLATAQYHHVQSEMRVYDKTVGWAPQATGFELRECFRPEHTLKLVADMSANEYVRLMVDADTYSLAGLEPYEEPDTRPPYWYFYIRHYGVANQNPNSYIDCVIVTQNEP